MRQAKGEPQPRVVRWISDDLWYGAKSRGVLLRMTMGEVICQALTEWIERHGGKVEDQTGKKPAADPEDHARQMRELTDRLNAKGRE